MGYPDAAAVFIVFVQVYHFQDLPSKCSSGQESRRTSLLGWVWGFWEGLATKSRSHIE